MILVSSSYRQNKLYVYFDYVYYSEQERRVTLSKRLKAIRVFRNMTLRQAADKSGMSPGSIHSYENDKMPGADKLAALANLYGVSADWLLGLPERPALQWENDAVADKAENAFLDSIIEDDNFLFLVRAVINEAKRKDANAKEN